MAKGFEGSHQHSLDAKGRLVMPVDFRAGLADGCHVAPGLDGCIAVYPDEFFDQVRASVTEAARRGLRERNAARAFIGNAHRVEVDRQGRIPLPQNLREIAHLDHDVVVIGVDQRIEIWDAPTWRERERDALTDLSTAIDFADLGII